ncbi:hypothetical protein ACFE04_001481 [Oxalis oulophora]
MLSSFVFPLPSGNLLIPVMSFVSAVSLTNAGYQEIKGKNVQYSKFSNVDKESSAGRQIQIPSRIGMLSLYTPAFLAGSFSFIIFPDESFRFLLVKSALTIHFFKRILELLFVHKYSGKMLLETVIQISLNYFISTAMTIYAQNIIQEFPDPLINLEYLGIILFLVGITGNFFHHYLLSKLRDEGDKQYKIPKGGMFDFVICPHYLFEILVFWGIAFISQTMFGFSSAIGTMFYLMGRSYATRKWYLDKFDDFPKHVKAIIPFVF